MPEAIRRGSLVNHPQLRTRAICVQDILPQSKIGVRHDRGDIHARAKRSRRLVCEDGMGGGEGKMDGILVSPEYSSAECLEIANSSVKSSNRQRSSIMSEVSQIMTMIPHEGNLGR